jgi:hypothetical protein
MKCGRHQSGRPATSVQQGESTRGLRDVVHS